MEKFKKRQMMTKMLQTACKTYIAKTKFLFHCNIKVKLPEEFGESLLDECFDLLKSIDVKYNSYQQNSFFDKINQSAGEWTGIDHHCSYIIKQLLKVSECTNGSYDISCMPILRLWGFYQLKNYRIPSDYEINEVLTKIDYRKIELKNNKIRIDTNQEIMTGSFIKSFAVDQLITFLKNKGVTDAIINAGGSTIYGINDNTHQSWKINLPKINNSQITDRQIAISNQCFSLSARENNKIIIQGKEYGHILNSKTGYPSTTIQVGVWSKNAFLSDILSTAIFSLEENDVIETIKNLKSIFEFDYYRIENNETKR